MTDNTVKNKAPDSLVPSRPATKKSKIVTAEQAVRLIKDGDVVATTGIVRCVSADYLLEAIAQAFLKDGRPRDLTVMIASCIGDSRADGPRVGLNRLAYEGLVRRFIAGHWGMAARMGPLAQEGKIEGYVFPQGVISQLFREMAGGRPGILTKVGLDTFIDPRNEAASSTPKPPRTWWRSSRSAGGMALLSRRPTHIAILRGTTADLDGNISMEREALFMEVLAIATAAHNTGGIVMAQVERIADRHSLNPRDVKIPGVLVDAWWWPSPKTTRRPSARLTTPPTRPTSAYRPQASHRCP